MFGYQLRDDDAKLGYSIAMGKRHFAITCVEVYRMKAFPFFPVDEASIAEAAEVLARAFQNDPFQSYIFPNSQERRSLSVPFFSVLLRYGVLAGEVWSTDEVMKAIAVSRSPEHQDDDPALLERSGFNRLPSVIGREAFERFTSFLDYLAPFQSRAVPDPHWYTMVLGVDAEHQGQGIGRALLHQILRRSDTDRVPCYLVTAQPKNVPFYTKSGFELVDQGVERKSGLQYWTFRRNPGNLKL